MTSLILLKIKYFFIELLRNTAFGKYIRKNNFFKRKKYFNYYDKHSYIFFVFLDGNYSFILYFICYYIYLCSIKKINKELYNMIKYINNIKIDKNFDFDEFNNTIENDLKKFDCSFLTIIDWEIFRMIVQNKGLEYISYLIRKKTEEIFLRDRKKYYWLNVSYLIINGNYSEANCMLNEYKFDDTKNEDNIYNGFVKILEALEEKKYRQDAFSKYLNNKNIHIFASSDDVNEIKDYDEENDIVACILYRGKNDLPDFMKKYKINISYYNIFLAEKLLNKRSTYLNELDFVCLKRKLSNNIKTRMRIINKSFELCMPFGFLLTGEASIFDIACYKTNSIILYNFNMFLKNKKYYDNYVANYVKQNTKFFRYVHHDILYNFMILKSLYTNNIVKCDEVLSNILKMTDKDYMKKLEKVDV